MAPKRDYSQDQMRKAIDEVHRGVNISAAATKYGVPRITLRNKIKGISPLECNLGPATVLTHDEEQVLVKWILYMADNHFPVMKDHLLDSVQKIITEKNLENCPFTNNRPGKKWYNSFFKRHPELSERSVQNLTKAREEVTEEELVNWFDKLKSYFKNKGLSDVLNDPTRIYNTDESAFYLQPKSKKVIVRKGEKNVYSSSSDEKENLTVLVTANAAGILAPPMIVFAYERIPTLIVKSVPSGWGIGRSESGWMCAKTFYEYVTNVFNPWLEANKIQKPVIFFLDGHKSHMSLHLANFCKDNGIEVIALFPNSTHLIQPMDVAVFRPLKLFWKNQISKWKFENPGQLFKKENFAPNLSAALEKISTETIKNGFRKSGLYPFSSEYVDMSKLNSRNRIISAQSQTNEVTKKKEFMQILEMEIQTVFSSEKIKLFNNLYYMPRNEVENILPNEDQSLFVIWAKNKNLLTESVSITTSSINEQPSGTLDEDSQANEAYRRRNCTPQKTIDSALSYQHPSNGQDTIHEVNNTVHPAIDCLMPCNEYHIVPNQVSSKTTPLVEDSNVTSKITANEFSTTSAIHTPITARKMPLMDVFNMTTNQSEKQVSIPIATSTIFTPQLNDTPGKIPSSSKTTPIGDVPSPFKRALFFPEPEIKKRRMKERLPSAITSDPYIAYVEKKEKEKKQRQDEKERRAKERKEKRILRQKEKEEKKQNKKNKNDTAKDKTGKSKRKKISSESSDESDMEVPYQDSESEYDLEKELHYNDNLSVQGETESNKNIEYLNESEEENIPSKDLPLFHKTQKDSYVIIKYENEYFPGIVKSIDGKQYEISTMVLSKGNTFRWPDTLDQIWYNEEAIVEFIKEPVKINKRGFYKVEEINKYLPFIL